MQTDLSNGVVDPKKQESFFVSDSLREAVKPLVERYGVKKKWMIYAAAIVRLLELSQDEQDKRIGEIAGADASRALDALIRRKTTEAAVMRGEAPPSTLVPHVAQFGGGLSSPGNHSATASSQAAAGGGEPAEHRSSKRRSRKPRAAKESKQAAHRRESK